MGKYANKEITEPTGPVEGFNPHFIYDIKKWDRPIVYIISDGDFIKIGKTRGGVERRFREIQTGNPRPLKVMAIIHDESWRDESVEKKLHKRFSYCRVAGEWFPHNHVAFDIFVNLDFHGGYHYLGSRIGLCKEKSYA